MQFKMPSQVLADEAEAELLASGIYVLANNSPSVALGLLWDLRHRYPGVQIRKYQSAGGGFTFESDDRLGTMPERDKGAAPRWC